MDIMALAAKPALIQITLDDEAIVEKYGEPVSFWTLDRQPIEVYMKLVNQVDEDGNIANYNEMVIAMKEFILDEKGKKVFDGDKVVPTDITIGAVTKIAGMLGN